MATGNNTLLRRVLDLSNQNKTLLSKSQVNNRLLFPISNLISESMVIDILMMFQFLSYGKFTEGEGEMIGAEDKPEENCISHSQMEPDVRAFIKRIVRACGIPLTSLEKEFVTFVSYLTDILKKFMGVYGMFSASIPNVDNNAAYGGIRLNTTHNFKRCHFLMYSFPNATSDPKQITCNATHCKVHIPMNNWITEKKQELESRSDRKNIVKLFLQLFLNVFELVLGIRKPAEQLNYQNMANEFRKQIQQ